MKHLILICALLAFVSNAKGQYAPLPFKADSVCLSPAEMELYKLINEYRAAKKLPPVPLSASLTYVAQVHARDIAINRPDKDERCNMHSWSQSKIWKGCCYTRDHKQAECMWNKPKELTGYIASGFEISAMFAGSGNPKTDAQAALNLWKSSSGHNDVIINGDSWNEFNWKAIGIGIYGDYAMVWFGTAPDEKNKLPVCR